MLTLLGLPPQVRKTLFALWITALLFWSSLSSMLPTLPLYIRDLGGTPHQIGIVMGAFAIGLLVSRAWLGRVADHRGRKIVLIIGLGVATTAPLIYHWSQSLWLLTLVRAFHGISIAAFTTGYLALVTDVAPSEHRGEVIGYVSLAHPIGVALGPSLGSWVHELAGYLPLFMISSGLALLGLICVWPTQEPKPSPKSKLKLTTNPQLFWRLLLGDRLRTPALVMLMVGLTFGIMATFIPLFIADLKLSLTAGTFYTAAAIASFLGRILTGAASDRWGRGIFISMSLGFYGLSMVQLAHVTSDHQLLLAAIVQGLGSGILIPMMAAMMADRSVPQERGRVLSLSLGGFDLGIAISGPVFGALVIPLGLPFLFVLAGGFSFLALALFMSFSSKNLGESLRFALGRSRDLYALKS